MPDSAQSHAEVPAEPLVKESAGRRGPRRLSRYLRGLIHGRDLPVILVLVAIVTIVSAFHPTYLQRTSLINTAQFASYIGCMAVGTVFLLSMREIDLSVG